MPVNVIDVTITGDGSRGHVTVESDLEKFPAQIEELQSAKTREAVLLAIVKEGITGNPGISRTVDPAYPINSKGEAIENLKDEEGNPLPPQHALMQPKAYRARFEVTARL
jgi:hypothetical protein